MYIYVNIARKRFFCFGFSSINKTFYWIAHPDYPKCLCNMNKKNDLRCLCILFYFLYGLNSINK